MSRQTAATRLMFRRIKAAAVGSKVLSAARDFADDITGKTVRDVEKARRAGAKGYDIPTRKGTPAAHVATASALNNAEHQRISRSGLSKEELAVAHRKANPDFDDAVKEQTDFAKRRQRNTRVLTGGGIAVGTAGTAYAVSGDKDSEKTAAQRLQEKQAIIGQALALYGAGKAIQAVAPAVATAAKTVATAAAPAADAVGALGKTAAQRLQEKVAGIAQAFRSVGSYKPAVTKYKAPRAGKVTPVTAPAKPAVAPVAKTAGVVRAVKAFGRNLTGASVRDADAAAKAVASGDKKFIAPAGSHASDILRAGRNRESTVAKARGTKAEKRVVQETADAAYNTAAEQARNKAVAARRTARAVTGLAATGAAGTAYALTRDDKKSKCAEDTGGQPLTEANVPELVRSGKLILTPYGQKKYGIPNPTPQPGAMDTAEQPGLKTAGVVGTAVKAVAAPAAQAVAKPGVVRSAFNTVAGAVNGANKAIINSNVGGLVTKDLGNAGKSLWQKADTMAANNQMGSSVVRGASRAATWASKNPLQAAGLAGTAVIDGSDMLSSDKTAAQRLEEKQATVAGGYLSGKVHGAVNWMKANPGKTIGGIAGSAATTAMLRLLAKNDPSTAAQPTAAAVDDTGGVPQQV